MSKVNPVTQPRAILSESHLYDLQRRQENIVLHPRHCIEASAIHATLAHYAEKMELPLALEIAGDRLGGGLLILAVEAAKAVCETIDWNEYDDGVFSYEHLECGPNYTTYLDKVSLGAHLLRATTRNALYQMADNWQAPDPEQMALVVADWASSIGLPLTTEAQALANSLQVKQQAKPFSFLDALGVMAPDAVILEHDGGARCSLALPPYSMSSSKQGPVLTFLYPPAGLGVMDGTCKEMLVQTFKLFKEMAADVEELQVFLSPRRSENDEFPTQPGWLEWGCQYRRKTGSRGWVALIQRSENFPIERHS